MSRARIRADLCAAAARRGRELTNQVVDVHVTHVITGPLAHLHKAASAAITDQEPEQKE